MTVNQDLIIRAADALNADTTLTTTAARIEEARALLQSYGVPAEDAVLAVHDVVQLAALRPPPPPPVVAGGRRTTDEPCRLERPCSAPTLAANGRCVNCGAYRKAPAGAPPPEPEPAYDVDGEMTAAGAAVHEAVEAMLRDVRGVSHMTPEAEADLLRRGLAVQRVTLERIDPARPARVGTFMARVKRATHRTDAELADILEVSRAGVQAAAGGRDLPLTTFQLDTLAEAVKVQQRQLRDLMIEIAEKVAG